MSNVKVMVSIPADLLEAVDNVKKANMEANRSALIVRALRDFPDIYEELQKIRGMAEGV